VTKIAVLLLLIVAVGWIFRPDTGPKKRAPISDVAATAAPPWGSIGDVAVSMTERPPARVAHGERLTFRCAPLNVAAGIVLVHANGFVLDVPAAGEHWSRVVPIDAPSGTYDIWLSGLATATSIDARARVDGMRLWMGSLVVE
jgi:hypothetical protein